MKRKLRDTLVVVTGASSGIGRATALAFAKQGYRVPDGASGSSAMSAKLFVPL